MSSMSLLYLLLSIWIGLMFTNGSLLLIKDPPAPSVDNSAHQYKVLLDRLLLWSGKKYTSDEYDNDPATARFIEKRRSRELLGKRASPEIDDTYGTTIRRSHELFGKRTVGPSAFMATTEINELAEAKRSGRLINSPSLATGASMPFREHRSQVPPVEERASGDKNYAKPKLSDEGNRYGNFEEYIYYPSSTGHVEAFVNSLSPTQLISLLTIQQRQRRARGGELFGR